MAKEKEIGKVSSYFSNVSVAAIKLSGKLKVGDKVHIQGHTTDFETIIRDFKRILAREGLFIVTFDVSIDGTEDVPKEKAAELVTTLEKYFSCLNEFDPKEELELLTSDKILTTHYVKNLDKGLLPWKCSRSRILKNILRLSTPEPFFTNLTCFCTAWSNE